jgi:tricorn protease
MKTRYLTPFLFCLLPALAPAQGSFETKPDIHGDNVIFTSEGDLWLGSISGHSARRITSDPGMETNAKFSPDGNWIAFSGEYEGGSDVYLMPTSGGPPKRLTYDTGALVQGWNPDGTQILFRSRRFSPVGGVKHLFEVPAKGGQSMELPVPRAEFGSLAPNGLLAYVPVSFEWANWFHYQGGSADKIWLADLKNKTFRKLTDYAGVDTTPVWCAGKIYFVSERSGWSNIWQLDPTSKAVKQCTFFNDAAIRYPSSDGHQVVFQHGAELAVYDPTDNKTAELTFAMDSDRIHERTQRVRLAAEIGPAMLYTNGGSLGIFGNGMSLGPTGKRILLEARGQIVSIGAEAGDMRVLEKKAGTRARFPIWKPDGKSFAFISDRTGENEIWIGDAAGGSEPKQLTHGLAANAFPPVWSPDGKWITLFDRSARFLLVDAIAGDIKVVDQGQNSSSYDNMPGTASFSPDSKYIAFSRGESNWISSVNLYEISTGKQVMVSDWRVNSYMPTFDTTGKFLMFLADNSIEPSSSALTNKIAFDNPTRVVMLALSKDAKSPFLPKDDEEGIAADQKQQADAKAQKAPTTAAIDWDGLTNRLISVPLPAGRYAMLESLPNKILVLNATISPAIGGSTSGQNELISYNLDSRAATTIVNGIDYFQKSFDGKKILFAQGRTLSVHEAETGPTTLGAGAVDLSPYTLTYDPAAEWRQVFEESWRIARDFYYDPGMHGLNWQAIREKYEAKLKFVGERRDLSRLLQDMVSELNTGHAYIVDPTPGARAQNMGFLGIDFAPVPGSNAVKITKLYRGDPWSPDLNSPLLDPGIGVKEGDYILEIAGQSVSQDQDIQALLLGTVGQTVAVMVNDKPSREGARVVRVRPLASEGSLRYQDWVMGRTRYVEEHGGPNFGYAHIPDMTAGGLVGFVKGHYPDVYKTAMIYDDRYNGGGFTSSLILQDIASYPTSWWKPRVGSPWTRESWANIGYKAALCNEYNFSDGELFVEAWKYMKLGPVVGTRTGGGEVGSGGGYTLVDHGSIYVPAYGAYRDDQWLVEGKGASPTVSVEDDPSEVIQGHDPQLDRAIAILKEELAKKPITIPQHPPFPVERTGTTPH